MNRDLYVMNIGLYVISREQCVEGSCLKRSIRDEKRPTYEYMAAFICPRVQVMERDLYVIERDLYMMKRGLLMNICLCLSILVYLRVLIRCVLLLIPFQSIGAFIITMFTMVFDDILKVDFENFRTLHIPTSWEFPRLHIPTYWKFPHSTYSVQIGNLNSVYMEILTPNISRMIFDAILKIDIQISHTLHIPYKLQIWTLYT